MRRSPSVASARLPAGAESHRVDVGRAASVGVSEVHGAASRDSRTPTPMAEGSATCTMHAPAFGAEQRERAFCNHADCRDPMAGQPSRTEASLRSESAYIDWKSQPPSARPMVKARAIAADVVHAAVKGSDRVSLAALAERVGVDKKTLRAWAENEKSAPLALAFAVPAWLGERILLAALREVRKASDGAEAVSSLVTWAKRVEESALRRDDLAELFEVQRRVANAIERAAREGK